MNLRIAVEHDIDRLDEITIAAKAHWGHDLAWVRSWVAAGAFASRAVRRREARLVEVDEVIAGWSALQQRGDAAWLEDLWVDPAYMGRGVGKELFLDAAERAGDGGAQR